MFDVNAAGLSVKRGTTPLRNDSINFCYIPAALIRSLVLEAIKHPDYLGPQLSPAPFSVLTSAAITGIQHQICLGPEAEKFQKLPKLFCCRWKGSKKGRIMRTGTTVMIDLDMKLPWQL